MSHSQEICQPNLVARFNPAEVPMLLKLNPAPVDTSPTPPLYSCPPASFSVQGPRPSVLLSDQCPYDGPHAAPPGNPAGVHAHSWRVDRACRLSWRSAQDRLVS